MVWDVVGFFMTLTQIGIFYHLYNASFKFVCDDIIVLLEERWIRLQPSEQSKQALQLSSSGNWKVELDGYLSMAT